MFLMSNKLDQLEFILEKTLGFRNMQEKLEKKNFSDQWCKAILNEEFYDSPAVVVVRRLCLDSTTICTKKNALKFTTKPANETSFFRWFFPPSHASKVVQKLAAETIWNSFAGCRADHDISRTNRNFIIPRFPFKLRRHVDISDWILNWHSVEAVRVRGRSQNTCRQDEGGGSKNICFCPRSGYKNCPRRGGGSKNGKILFT